MTRAFQISIGRVSFKLGLFDQFLVSGANFATTVILARRLGPEEFGKFSLAWITLLFLASMQLSLVLQPMMSSGPRLFKSEPGYFGAVIWHQSLLSFVSAILCFFGALTVDAFDEARNIAVLATPLAALIFAAQWHEFIRRYFYTSGNPAYALGIDVVTCVSRIGLLLFLMYGDFSTTGNALFIVAASFLLSSLLGSLGIPWNQCAAAPIARVAAYHWNISKWLAATSVLQWVIGNIFVISTAAYLGVASAGALRAIQNMIGVFNMVFVALENTIPVGAARMPAGGSHGSIVRYILHSSKSGVAVLVAGSIWFIAFPGWIINFIYGAKYAQYGWVLPGLTIIALLTFASVLFRIFFRVIENTKPIFLSYLAGGIASMLCAPALISIFELKGALLAMALVYIAILTAYALFFRDGSKQLVA